MNGVEKAATVETIPVNLHVGNAIQYLGQHYASGIRVVREAAQNAFDEGAQHIFVKVDCVGKTLQVFDDGDGASLDEIRQKFKLVCESLKKGIAGMIGEKGIGNLAGLAVADRWQLVTRNMHVKEDPLRVYTFERAELEKADDVNLTAEELPAKTVHGAPFRANSVMKLHGVDEAILRQMGDRDGLERELQQAFSPQLKLKKIEFRVSYRDFKGRTSEFVVRRAEYRGAEMEPVEIETEYGIVTFRLYHNAHPVEDPSIVVQHQGTYALPLGNFFHVKVLPKEIEHYFARGYFEGEILLGFCKMNADRYAFVPNHERQVFAQAIETFTEDVLKPLVEQFEQADRQERLRRVAEATVRRMRSFLSRHSASLSPALKAIVIKYKVCGDGSGNDVIVTSQPKPPTKKKKKTLTLAPAALKEQREKTKKERESGGTPPTRRKAVVELNEGLAIQLLHPDAEEGFGWRSRTTHEGMIQVNVVSNEFLEAERRGQTELSRFMLLLLQKELTCASLTPIEAKVFNQGFEGSFITLWRATLQV